MDTPAIKKPKFRFLDTHPRLGVVLLNLQMILLLYGIILNGSSILFTLVHLCISLIGNPAVTSLTEAEITAMAGESALAASPYSYVLTIVYSFLFLWVHKKRFSPDYRGSFVGGDVFTGFRLSLVLLAYIAYIAVSYVITDTAELRLTPILASLSAGILEETISRGIPLSFAMRHRNTKGMIVFSATATSLLFALLHAVNILAGADVRVTLIQIGFAFGIGVFFAALYLRSGNLMFPMILHGIYDIVVSLDPTSTDENMVQIQTYEPILLLSLVIGLIFAVIGYFLLRRSKHDAIRTVWHRKWSGFGIPAAQPEFGNC